MTTTPLPRQAAARDTAATDTARLFLALWPDDATRAALQAWQAVWRWPPGARLTAPAHLHLTLHFIGSVPRQRLPELAERLARPVEPMTLRLAWVDAWHHGLVVLVPGQPGDVSGALTHLHQSLSQALAELDLPVETRPFRPHVTLARHAAGAQAGDTPTPPVVWRADQGYVLAESAGGYRVLQRF